MLQDVVPQKPVRLHLAVAQALAMRGSSREWPEVLRDSFADELREKARRELPLQLNIGLAVACLVGPLAYVTVPSFGWLSLILPGGVAAVMTALAYVMLRTDRIGAAKLCAGLSVILFVSICMHISTHSSGEIGARMAMATVILLPMSMHSLPFSLDEKARFILAFITANVLAGAIPHSFAAASFLQHFTILVMVGGGSWMLVKRIHELEARTFLQDLKGQFDRIELEQRNALLRELSESDPLTGLANRRSFERVYRETFASSDASNVAMMMIDIDHFKDFNDKHGHQAGDRCLVTVARELARCVARHDGHVARFGGEEFVILLNEKGDCNASDIAHEILASVRKLQIIVPQEQAQNITVSIGLAKGAADFSMSRLIECADKALYNAKEMGRNRVEMFQCQRKSERLS